MASNDIFTPTETVITPEAMLEHWQGHRRLTRHVIEAFPEDKLFSYSIGGMRSFSELAMEMIGMTAPGINGIVTGQWQTTDQLEHHTGKPGPATKAALLERWDDITAEIDRLWQEIPPNRFIERDLAFGQYEGTINSLLFYFIDNEIHHRGQGYVYLRSLGIEPPAFYNRD
ncbi:Uncharacterized damage-inducible protein DinB (forms a four-helix bundle) [Chitinophaga sp. CF118]|uniref:DinB family protein n=1 Tax=Chitinophaga sp. CF118 TaxID=1884367 RepID=UPI0008E4E817|nr:DinB family protein [Chitinophaga sp. CF118]SFE44414.1 Uncharacterized damage-inducible protein DinB (forms a four-helix bundle) [Chitinophaga sp. CF118]